MDSRQRSTPKALQEEPEKLSMREIFAKTYRDNPPDFTVKRDIANKYGVTYFFIMITAQYYIGGWVLFPYLIKDSTQLLYWKLFITFILVQSFYNYFQVIRKYINKAERRPEDADKTEAVGWRLCTICQYNVPPRSFHCKLCKACILRQDHHCFFAAGCIGHFTFAYFIFMCMWILLAQCLALYWEVIYIQQEFTSIWQYIPPTSLLMALVDANTWFNFVGIVFVYCTVINAGLVGFYLFMSILGALGNLTFYEGSKGIKRFSKPEGIFANMRASLGAYYWIRWLVPFYVAPEGNGYDWYVMRYSN